MAPNSIDATGVLYETDADTPDLGLAKKSVQQTDNFQMKYILFPNIIASSTFHSLGIYGAYLAFYAKWQTLVFTFLLYIASVLGASAGAHRLWSHKAYKAKWPLRVILMIFNSMAFQYSVIDWSYDHRTHHKYADTDADPHNATRGFFFSHTGWLLRERHPEFEKKAKDIDLSDLYADPILVFQKKYYAVVMILFCFVIPTVVPVYWWGESPFIAFLVPGMFRFIASINATFLVNSAAHKYGTRPYDKNMLSTEIELVSFFMLGEGYHNYHHTFPWDYKNGEHSNNILNFVSLFIEFFAKIGWAYDLKTVSEDIIKKRVARTGDGTHPIWGWGDKDQSLEEKKEAIKINPKDD